MNFWVKIDRFCAWILFLCIIIYLISGYGMTKNIIDTNSATNLHNNILPLIIITTFTVHASYATRTAMIRWQWWNIYIKIIWTIIFLAIFFGFGYIEIFYKIPQSSSQISNQTTIPTSTSTSTQSISTTTPTSTTKNFTIEELKKYDGQNGNPPYVAVDGVVYDMSQVFTSGSHYQHIAGQELTDEFFSHHSKSEITKYPVVGNLSE